MIVHGVVAGGGRRIHLVPVAARHCDEARRDRPREADRTRRVERTPCSAARCCRRTSSASNVQVPWTGFGGFGGLGHRPRASPWRRCAFKAALRDLDRDRVRALRPCGTPGSCRDGRAGCRCAPGRCPSNRAPRRRSSGRLSASIAATMARPSPRFVIGSGLLPLVRVSGFRAQPRRARTDGRDAPARSVHCRAAVQSREHGARLVVRPGTTSPVRACIGAARRRRGPEVVAATEGRPRLTAARLGCTNGSRAPRPQIDPARPRRPERTRPPVTFPELEQTAPSAPSLSRIKRTLTEQAIAAATAAAWEEAAEINRKLIEYGPEAEAENRLAKSLWEMGDLARRPRALPEGARARPDQPDRRAQHRPPQAPHGRGGRPDGGGRPDEQGAGLHLRRGDRQDRLRPPHGARSPEGRWPR